MGILETYNFPTVNKSKPAFHIQKLSCKVMVEERRAYNLNDLGTGKTRCALWSYDYLHKKGEVDKMLVVCPLSTMNRVWEREITMEFEGLTCTVLYGTKEKRLKNLNRNVNVYIINHDGIATIFSELMRRLDIDVIVFDELSAYRNGGTRRTALAKQIAHDKKYVWGLTGAPMPREVTDVWGQAIIVTPHTVPKYFSHMRHILMTRVSTFKWEPRPNAEVMAINYMRPSVRFTLDEVVELPPKVLQYHEAPLGPNQARIYNAMKNKAIAMIEDKKIDALNAAAVAGKLLQIACGYVYTREKETVVLDNHERLQLTLDLIDSTQNKVIVFVPFKSALNGLSDMFKDNNVEHAIVHGGVSKTHRNLIFSAFQDTNRYKVLLAHPVCMSHGLTLTAASTIIWFGPTLSLDTYFQANGRITRIGQEHKQLIAMIGGTKIERRIYSILAKNERVQRHFLDLIAEETERTRMGVAAE